MAEKIYTLTPQGELKSLEEKQFSAEAKIQELIADHPELLAGEQIDPENPLRWILIRREMPIEDWAVDHLLIDQHARPTLVEVKRGDNPDNRRKVVGQMLDYAATAAGVWSRDELRQAFEKMAKDRDDDPYDELRDFLKPDHEMDGDDFAGDFWEMVSTNLEANRLRLLFVADDIPDQLERVVKFLNQQMPNIEVLAVEVKRYSGPSGHTLVPRIIGKVDTLSSSPAGTKVRVIKGKTQYVGQIGEAVKIDPNGGVLVKFDDGQRKWLSQNSVAAVN